MKVIKVDELAGQGYQFDSRAYPLYLQSVKDKLPQSSADFAGAVWHYDTTHHQCPHDSWVESIEILEVATGTRGQIRSVEVSVKLLGAFHDGNAIIRYIDVVKYQVQGNFLSGTKPNAGHGDWLIDEVALSDNGLVSHEILLLHGSIFIECRDIDYQWVPLARQI